MKAILVLFAALVACAYGIWPQPQEIAEGTTQLTLSPKSFRFITSSTSALLKGAIGRYQAATFPFSTGTSAPDLPLLTNVTINVLSSNEDLQFGVDEKYSLIVIAEGATITANTVFGAMHGLESLAQLVVYNITSEVYTINNAPVYVNDYSRFPWRGVMIDTGRHFLQVETIQTMIDAIAYNKMNTLHWHVTDSQSFPMQSTTYPNTAKYGAYQFPQATYSPDDVKAIVTYGYERGVRVVPEFDIPGHSYSWGLGNPGLTLNCSIPDWGTNGVTLDVTNSSTYEFIQGFVGDMKPLFMDNYMHFGGDEVNYQCWNTSTIMTWMEEHNVSSFEMLEQYFFDNLQTITNKNQINRIFWEDAFCEHNVTFQHGTSTFEVWLSLYDMVRLVEAGYPVILASGFYLDVQQPAPVQHYEWVDTWQDLYNNEPFRDVAQNLTEQQRALVLGGEACMWGEAVEDENIMSRVWIRASGAAELLWSPFEFTQTALNDTNFDDTQSRLIEWRCRLKRRGIHATALRPDWCPLP